jgi:hypothetical protein
MDNNTLKKLAQLLHLDGVRTTRTNATGDAFTANPPKAPPCMIFGNDIILSYTEVIPLNDPTRDRLEIFPSTVPIRNQYMELSETLVDELNTWGSDGLHFAASVFMYVALSRYMEVTHLPANHVWPSAAMSMEMDLFHTIASRMHNACGSKKDGLIRLSDFGNETAATSNVVDQTGDAAVFQYLQHRGVESTLGRYCKIETAPLLIYVVETTVHTLTERGFNLQPLAHIFNDALPPVFRDKYLITDSGSSTTNARQDAAVPIRPLHVCRGSEYTGHMWRDRMVQLNADPRNHGSLATANDYVNALPSHAVCNQCRSSAWRACSLVVGLHTVLYNTYTFGISSPEELRNMIHLPIPVSSLILYDSEPTNEITSIFKQQVLLSFPGIRLFVQRSKKDPENGSTVVSQANGSFIIYRGVATGVSIVDCIPGEDARNEQNDGHKGDTLPIVYCNLHARTEDQVSVFKNKQLDLHVDNRFTYQSQSN